MIGVRYAQNHTWVFFIFLSPSTPILIFFSFVFVFCFFFQFYVKDFIKLRQTVKFHGVLSICFITNLVIFVLERSQIWYSQKNVSLSSR